MRGLTLLRQSGRAGRLFVAGLLGLCVLTAGACGVATPMATPPAATPSARAYLALGDSVPFGYMSNPPPGAGGTDPYADAANFVGYPTYVGAALNLATVNAACPGATSSGMIVVDAPDNGCRPYRALHPLHVSYGAQSQLQFAESFLHEHLNTQLVTLQIGANDGLLVIERCGGTGNLACIQQQVASTVLTLTANLTTIVQGLRATGYRRTLVLVNYYSLHYGNGALSQLVSTLDSAIATVAASNHLPVADAFTAFENAAAGFGGNTCASALLGTGTSLLGPCDLHPNQAGHQLIATLVERAAK